jgi:cellulose synthase/poly-beta-1,6-N-acetylglucosamine synthase-like glycosyltransferase
LFCPSHTFCFCFRTPDRQEATLVTDDVVKDSASSSRFLLTVAIIVGALCLLIIIVLVILVVVRRRRKKVRLLSGPAAGTAHVSAKLFVTLRTFPMWLLCAVCCVQNRLLWWRSRCLRQAC